VCDVRVCLLSVCCVYWVVLTVCGSECALYGMFVVVCVMCRLLNACRVRSWGLYGSV